MSKHAMQGPLRQSPVGARVGRWSVGCPCGWKAIVRGNKQAARAAYREHVPVAAATANGTPRTPAAARRAARFAARLERRRQIQNATELVDARRTELGEVGSLMNAPVISGDKQIRQRTGKDDHLELGEYKPARPKRVAPGPMTMTRKPDLRRDLPT